MIKDSKVPAEFEENELKKEKPARG